MTGDSKQREIPYCAVCLVVAAITCHAGVLVGNLATSKAMESLGDSSGGWSNLALDMADSLSSELDMLLTQVSESLVGTMEQIGVVQTILDTMLSNVGGGADNATLSILEKRQTGLALFSVARDAPNLSNISDSISGMLDSDKIAGRIPGGVDVSATSQIVNTIAARLMMCNASTLDQIRAAMKSSSIPSLDGFMECAKDSGVIPSLNQTKAAVKIALEMVVLEAMKLVNVQLQTFIDVLKPALLQVGKWLVSFGDKIQATLETFSTTMDLVQKLFDQMMSKAVEGGEGSDEMQYDTFTLFDVSNTGAITVQDLVDTSKLYGVEALSGDGAEKYLSKYDADGNGELDKIEFANFVEDPELPGVMAVVLRKFAKKLSTVAGNVAAGKLRDEVAFAVVQYITLISAKNKTKVQWVSNTLTNRSLPIEFTAAVMKELAMDVDNPDKLTTADVGELVVGEMYALEPGYVKEALELMSSPSYWSSEGFDPQDQPEAVKRVTSWVVTAETEKGGGNDSVSLLGLFGGDAQRAPAAAASASAADALQRLPAAAASHVEGRCRRHLARRRAKRAARLGTYYRSEGAQRLRTRLLGGAAASEMADDPLVEMAVKSGQPAAPETLRFARFLSLNASSTADRFQAQCFDYSGTSSNAADSFAAPIKGMVKKIMTFINQLEEYSTPEGVERLEAKVTGVQESLPALILPTIEERVDELLDRAWVKESDAAANATADPFAPHDEAEANTTAEKTEEGARSRLDVVVVGGRRDPGPIGLQQQAPGSASAVNPDPLEIVNKLEELQGLLANLQAILPDVVKNLKNARTEVSAASSMMKSTFDTFKEKGPPIFGDLAVVYSSMWTFYFLLFAIVTVCVLGFGFWASGWFGGPKGSADDGYEAPVTFMEYLSVCRDSCLACSSESDTCFWSAVLIIEVIVLVLFIVSIFLCLLAGVQAFLVAGCAPVYILGDDEICKGSLRVVTQFLETFGQSNAVPLSERCEKETLLTCSVIRERLQISAVYTTIGSVLATLLTLQMIIESAVLHERARWLRLIESESKEA